MKKFEYKIVESPIIRGFDQDRCIELFADWLNVVGDQGWELCYRDQIMLIFKKEKIK